MSEARCAVRCSRSLGRLAGPFSRAGRRVSASRLYNGVWRRRWWLVLTCCTARPRTTGTAEARAEQNRHAHFSGCMRFRRDSA
eukprot:86365-Prymnesium_polylepis.1